MIKYLSLVFCLLVTNCYGAEAGEIKGNKKTLHRRGGSVSLLKGVNFSGTHLKGVSPVIQRKDSKGEKKRPNVAEQGSFAKKGEPTKAEKEQKAKEARQAVAQKLTVLTKSEKNRSS
jgi:hypothetical protein